MMWLQLLTAAPSRRALSDANAAAWRVAASSANAVEIAGFHPLTPANRMAAIHQGLRAQQICFRKAAPRGQNGGAAVPVPRVGQTTVAAFSLSASRMTDV